MSYDATDLRHSPGRRVGQVQLLITSALRATAGMTKLTF